MLKTCSFSSLNCNVRQEIVVVTTVGLSAFVVSRGVDVCVIECGYSCLLGIKQQSNVMTD